MSFEIITRGAPEDRRTLPLDPASPPVVLAGQIVQKDGTTGYAVLADGATNVAAPCWAFTKTSRLDTSAAKSITIVEAPFVAKVNTDGYGGTPAAGDSLIVGTGATAGKLITGSGAGVVAECIRAPDSNGVIEFKAIR